MSISIVFYIFFNVGLLTARLGKEASKCTGNKPKGAPSPDRQECDARRQGNIFNGAHRVGIAAAVRARDT